MLRAALWATAHVRGAVACLAMWSGLGFAYFASGGSESIGNTLPAKTLLVGWSKDIRIGQLDAQVRRARRQSARDGSLYHSREVCSPYDEPPALAS